MLNSNETLIIGIDIQEKLVKMLKDPEIASENCAKLLKTAEILNIKTLLTEQYPKGLGSTIDEIKNIKDFKTFEKTSFSILRTDNIKDYIEKLNLKNIVIFGIETHICVYQTVMDLLENGYNVYVVADCCFSRNNFNHQTALYIMRQKGAVISSLEIVLFEFLKSSKHEKFKECQSLIK